MKRDEVFKKVLDCCFTVHTSLGPGLLENAYQECLFYEIQQTGLELKKQFPLPLVYKSIRLDTGYRLDLLVDNQVVVEIKAIESFSDIHVAQILTYLKLSGCHLGLLVNFNVPHLKNGIKRMIL
ncbi:MAG: GxxExxY protein [Bacteroidetes bacterium]|nr:GxxExxY protein [Bacteroidota bacterium]